MFWVILILISKVTGTLYNDDSNNNDLQIAERTHPEKQKNTNDQEYLQVHPLVLANIEITTSDEENLLAYLFANYNPSARPVLNSSATVSVNLKFSLLQIQELNVRNQILTSTGFLILEWRDERLTWTPDISSLDEVVVKGENIWRPEFAVINGAESIYGEYNEFQAIIRSDGFIRWEPGGIFKTMCGIDITFYPFDTQRCQIKFGAWSYHTTKMNLTTDEKNIRIDAYEKNGEWHVMKTDAKRNEFAFACCPQQRFSYISFAVQLRRRHTFYVMNVIVPGLLTSAVLLSLFYCVPSQKVHIGVAALLSFRLFLVNVADTVPRTSDHIPLLGIYLTCTMAITTLAMVATVLVGNLYERKDRPVPKWLKTIMMKHLARILCMGSSGPLVDGEKTATRTKRQRSRSFSCGWCCLNLKDEKKGFMGKQSSEYLTEDEELHLMATYNPASRRTNVRAHRTPSKNEKGRLKESLKKPDKLSRSKSFDIGSALASIAIRHMNDTDKRRRQGTKTSQKGTATLQKEPADLNQPSNTRLSKDLTTSTITTIDEQAREQTGSGEIREDTRSIDSNRNIDHNNKLPSLEEELGEACGNSTDYNNHASNNNIHDREPDKATDLPNTRQSSPTDTEVRNRDKSRRSLHNEEREIGGKNRSNIESDKTKKRDEKPVNYSKEWAHVAAVCDRLFFWLCLFFILGTTMLLFHPLTTSRFFKIPVIDKT